jgi:hypothetical protein
MEGKEEGSCSTLKECPIVIVSSRWTVSYMVLSARSAMQSCACTIQSSQAAVTHSPLFLRLVLSKCQVTSLRTQVRQICKHPSKQSAIRKSLSQDLWSKTGERVKPKLPISTPGPDVLSSTQHA